MKPVDTNTSSPSILETRILVVEDDPDIRNIVEYNLQREGFAVTACESGKEGVEIALSEHPALILLDIMLPDFNGVEVCRRLRSHNSTKTTPIVMMTAKSEDCDIIGALKTGADDYIIKPFNPKVLVARVRARLRSVSREKPDDELFDSGGLSIDPGRYQVSVDGKPVDLTLTEFRILSLFANNPDWVFSRYEIIDRIQGSDVVVTDRSVDVQIFGLRRKLGRLRDSIKTIRGVGYRFHLSK